MFFQLFEAADIIQKLQLVAQELPSSKYSGAQKQIAQKYDEIERSLIEEFAKAQVNKNFFNLI
jgi:exocyst complex component 5